jgi:hypothetical protein
MVLIRSDSCSRVLGIPHLAAPPPLSRRSKTDRSERSHDQAYCFDRSTRSGKRMDVLPFTIVMLPPSEEGRGIALVALRSDGSLDFARNFLFTYRPTREAQKSYATELAHMLRFKVLELSE